MSVDRCAGCGVPVSAAGGVENLWTFGDRDGSDGTAITLELADGSTHLLCFSCVDALPDEPTESDVDALDAAME